MVSLTFFATTPRGMEPLLEGELRAAGARNVRRASAGVAFSGPLECAYKIALWSRVANRILLNLKDFRAADEGELYAGIGTVDWSEHLDVDGTLAVNAHCANSSLTHSQYVALKIKDAIVDQFRAKAGRRPSVDRERPDVRVNAYLNRNRLKLSLDLSGGSLHRRSYRSADSGAPLKENLAAAILLFAEWEQIAAAGGELLDPMCGSGTLLIEAAMIAADIAPGLRREHYGFSSWKQHKPELWEKLLAEARDRRDHGLAGLPTIRGYDRDATAVAAAKRNAQVAGLADQIQLQVRDLAKYQAPTTSGVGLFVTNPPYGVRLDSDGSLSRLYGMLGHAMRQHPQWRAAVLTANPDLTHRFRLPADRELPLKNGDLDCRLRLMKIPDAVDSVESATPSGAVARHTEGDDIGMFVNRIRKNHKSLRGWARQNNLDAYRVYDGDLPQFNAAVDVFYCGDSRTRVHLQEYAPPKTVDADRANARLDSMVAAIPELFDCREEDVFVKTRRRQRGEDQYSRLGRHGSFHTVREGDCEFRVNFEDYQDCGLFLDHRKVRQRIQNAVAGKTFLNLFAYTGAASVYAAVGGAASITTLDMSQRYLDWARENWALNPVESIPHAFIEADCIEWLTSNNNTSRFDLILLDPPTFSNSKKMSTTWDVQRDHTSLVLAAMQLLNPGGKLVFSTNRQKFRLDAHLESTFSCRDVSRKTVPRDFARTPGVHRCWEITA
ncbi:MAG: bifunctional 23S rRNA (guanine(2069)-N(7))-methyltransferase RlmK/23S rRNA (guanine(2445)-N(2))-methyltransferase RlmL [Pseudomonadota bacterium]